MPGLSWVDGACWRWLVGVDENGLKVRSEGCWEVLGRVPLRSRVQVTHSVEGMGVELRCGRLCGRVLMWESGGLGVVNLVVLAEG